MKMGIGCSKIPERSRPIVTENSERSVDNSERKDNVENPKEIPPFPWINQYIDVFVYEVHDGDTVKVLIDYKGVKFNLSLRVLDIDTPEVSRCSDLEKKAGIKVKEYVARLVEGKWVKAFCVGWDKYGGRIDAHIYFKGQPGVYRAHSILSIEGSLYTSLSEHLLCMEYAKPYDGKSRKPEWQVSELKTICFVCSPS